jgi:DNA-binding NarL/FixJ family response regulator
MPVKLFLIIRNEAFVKVFSEFLAKSIDAEVVGHSKPGPDAEPLALQTPADIIMMDVKKEHPYYYETMQSILEKNPMAKIIGISSLFHEDVKATLRKTGAKGYLLRSVDLQGIKKIIHEVKANETDFALAI